MISLLGHKVADDYSGEEDWLDELFEDFNPGMDLNDYAENEEKWYSYTGDPDVDWNRTLDYMFTNGTWVNDGLDNMVLQNEEQGGFNTIMLSDHAPVQVILEVQ